ncbi:MAG: hypothetical protein FJ405_14820, partial [Verrucomicrobia bacterium]|nr:hypothetical protein [Verrucomicrobiota bacterium]
ADGDGVDDKSHLMEHYEDAPRELLGTLRGGGVSVMMEPYTDRWGTFLSAYAPVFGEDGSLVAAAGVDMDLAFHDESLFSVRRDSQMAGAMGLILATCVGVAAAFYEKRLIRSVDSLSHAMEQAMAGERAKNRFLATMSHEFRTPMNAIVGSTELLRGTRLDGVQAEHVETIIQSSGSLLAMMDDVLDYSGGETGGLKHEPVDLRALGTGIIAAFRGEAARKGLVLEMDFHPTVPARWQTNSRSLVRILSHLVSNAVKFTSRGEVRLRVEPAADADGRQLLRFRVSDTGIGIAADQQGKVLQPFVQLDASANRRHEGAGLGLALCQRLCRGMNTVLEVESEPGKGSAFGFLLPGEAAPAETLRAILITGDRLQRGILSRLLEKRGWQVQTADNLEGAARLPGGGCVIFDLAAVPAGAAAEYASRVTASLPAACHVAIDSGIDESTHAAVLKAGVCKVISRNPAAADLDGLEASHDPVFP